MNAPTTPVTYDGVKGRILEMLGNGLSPEVTASALGITASYVSQLLSEDEFSRQVVERRFVNLQAATTRDRKYDSLEDQLIEKLKESVSMLYKPTEIARILSLVNSATRRGATAPEQTHINQTVVQLVLPTQLISRFVKDANNQVIVAGDQNLVTIPAAQLSQKFAQNVTQPKIAATQESESSA